MSKYEAWGTRELIERIEELEAERKNWAWIICEAHTILRGQCDALDARNMLDQDEETFLEAAENLLSYTEQHGREALEVWNSEK